MGRRFYRDVQGVEFRMPSQPHLIFAMAVCLVLVFGQGIRAELDDKVESSSLLPTKTIKGHTMDKLAKGNEEAVSNANAHVSGASHAGPSRQRTPDTKLHNKDSTETGNTDAGNTAGPEKEAASTVKKMSAAASHTSPQSDPASRKNGGSPPRAESAAAAMDGSGKQDLGEAGSPKQPGQPVPQQPHKDVHDRLGETQKSSTNNPGAKPPSPAPHGTAYIPLHPTVPKLTINEEFLLKGVLKLDSTNTRQVHVNNWADVSASPSGASIFAGNMHVLKVQGKKEDEFRFSNDHGEMGGIGFAANYPHYNKASIVSSKAKASKKDQSFVPETLVTFTGTGDVGVGVTNPASKLHVQAAGNSRLINANHWLDASACASGVALVAGNSYVSTVADKMQFRFANSHGSIRAIGLAFNYPAWNKASVISSGSTQAEASKEFKPLVIQTYTSDGKVGVGTDSPTARLSVASPDRQLSVNDWLDVSSQGTVGFIGMNAHLAMKGTQTDFMFSNTGKDVGAIGMATNFPVANQLSIVASPEKVSKMGTVFKPNAIATFTAAGVGVGTTTPISQLDVQHKTNRQVSANKFADVSANDLSQGFFGGNGYTVGSQYTIANSHPSIGAVGLATHYPTANSASIVSSGSAGGKAGESFKPKVLAEFKPDGSLEVGKDLIVKGDLRVTGRMLSADDDSQQYDMLAAHEALVNENMQLQERMQRMEQTMATMMEASAR